MTLQDLGNLGEFVGAIAVVITLVYLALQIRQNTAHLSQNTRAVRLAALDASLESGNRVREILISNPELSELYIRGLQGYSQLDRPERLRFGMLLRNLLGAIQATHMRDVVMEIDPGGFEGVAKMLDSMLVHPGVREWWTRHRGEFVRQDFRELVEERLARLDSGPAT